MLHRIAPVFALLLGVACATSPTGRKQLILVPDAQMDAMGSQAFQTMLQKQEVEESRPVNRYVECVATHVIRALEGGETNWEVVVFEDETANAFALPGGKIGIHTGMLKLAENQAQLAAVIGHEIGHVLARHGAERVSQSLVIQGGLAAVSAAMQDSRKRQLILAGLGAGATVGVLLPFSRKHESEADTIGLELMARAGFDPRESVELWRNMAKRGGGQPPEFLSTHPAHGSRIEELQEDMSHAWQTFRKARRQGQNPRCEEPRLVQARGQ